uniref:5'-nucleotidase n=1 Tax=Mola mola TaxID=94237 RepID=A0A3Q3XIQ2_MOLML
MCLTGAEMAPLLSLLLLPGFSVSDSGTWDLVLLHTNDVHARVEETSRSSGKCSGAGGCLARVARRATMNRKIRASESHVLLLDAGDQFQGTVWFNHYSGAEAAHFMNQLGCDAMALGNHEFDNDIEGLMKPFLEQKYPNVKLKQPGGPLVAGCSIVNKCLLLHVGSELEFEDEVTSLQRQVNRLQTLGVNKIIALGHSGFDVDQEIAKKVCGVDVVVGGHTNTFLFSGWKTFQSTKLSGWKKLLSDLVLKKKFVFVHE